MPDKNNEWKEKYNLYITSSEWYELKIDLLQKRGCKCEKCGKRRPANVLHIHHLTYKRLFYELPEDLQILCPQCHMKEHGLLKPKIKVVKRKKHKNKSSFKKFQSNERRENEKFIAAKRKRMKGKSLAAWQQ